MILSEIMGHIIDDDQAYAIVRRLLEALPSGSYLSLNDGTNVLNTQVADEATQLWNQTVSAPYRTRTPDDVARFFDGLELVEPGVVSCPLWRPEAEPFGPPTEVDAFGGVARKP